MTRRKTLSMLAAATMLIFACTPADDDGPSAETSGSDADVSALDVAGDILSDMSSSDRGTDAPTDGGTDLTDTVDLPPPPPPTCPVPIELVDTSSPDRVVGDGTPASCTRDALAEAAALGGTIAFDCGLEPTTIAIDETVQLRADLDTTIDGVNRITLDGGGQGRVFELYNGNYRVNTNRATLQRLTISHGRAHGTDYIEPDSVNPSCAYGWSDGSGGAILVRDTIVHVIDCVFANNTAASPGPDVGGGAIYALGSLDVTVVGSTFVGNSGSNGGAVGLLQTTGTFVNNVFRDNTATGVGANYAGGDAQGCPGVGHENQGGAGGNGGAISIDGADDLEQYFCGVTFQGNAANELGGCVFRTANREQRPATFVQCLLDGNSADAGGGCLYISNSDFTLDRSLVAHNRSQGLGGGVRTELGTRVSIVNTTFYENVVTEGLAAALSVDAGGSVRNCTFANNRIEGSEVVFTAAIRATSDLRVDNTIFSDNSTQAPWNPQACWFTPFAGENNFQWPTRTYNDARDDWPCTENITWADAELGPLQDNGGPTSTVLPASDGVVIGAGQDCPATDQRGAPRPSSGCAAGAVEP